MDKKSVLVIVNPCSGRMVASRIAFDYANQFKDSDYELFIRMTTGKYDATDIAKRLADKFDVIMCRGGDGTISETINGIIESGADVPFACIPAGTTNDFAKSNGIPVDSKEAINLVINGRPVPQDLGLFDDKRYFVYTACFGAFTRTAYGTPQRIKNKFGYLSYLGAAVVDLKNLKKIHAKVTCDGVVYEDDYIYGSISNSLSVGGIFRFKKDMMSFDDGLFEVVLVKMPRSVNAFTKILTGIMKSEFDEKYITVIKGKEISFDFGDEEVPWTLDGEFGGAETKSNFKCIKHGFRIYKPTEDTEE